MPALVSIILPTFEESACLRRAIESVGARDGVEIVVADGGSTDATLEVATDLADRVVSAPRGRAAQMNAGAAAARGEVLLFLHADAQLPPRAVAAARATMTREAVVAGAFALDVEGGGWGLRVVTWGVRLRSRYLRLPYGDQGLFLRRVTFEEMGGYRDVEIMEDVELVRRLRRRGKIVLVPESMTTSGRRWHANGVLRTTAVNWAAAAMYGLAVPPRRIRRFYDTWLDSGRT